MRVLNVVTSGNAPFFKNQIKAQESAGMYQDTLSLPHRPMGGGVEDRNLLEYPKLYLRILYQNINDYDIIHINNAKLAAFGLLQTIRPVVLTIWGSDWKGWKRKINKKIVPHCDTVIVSSKWMTDRVPFEHEVVPFPFDSDLFRPIPQDKARAEIGWEDKRTVVLFPYDKSNDVKNYPLAKSVVEGTNVDAEIVSISGVPYDQMPYYMNASDVVIATSKGEPGPGVVKEAALCNVPVVSTDTGFVAEALDGVSNSYVGRTREELIDGLERVLENGGRSDGRKKASEWSPETMGKQLTEVYKKTIQHS